MSFKIIHLLTTSFSLHRFFPVQRFVISPWHGKGTRIEVKAKRVLHAWLGRVSLLLVRLVQGQWDVKNHTV